VSCYSIILASKWNNDLTFIISTPCNQSSPLPFGQGWALFIQYQFKTKTRSPSLEGSQLNSKFKTKLVPIPPNQLNCQVFTHKNILTALLCFSRPLAQSSPLHSFFLFSWSVGERKKLRINKTLLTWEIRCPETTIIGILVWLE
jgi:hypothetical protein